MLREFLPDQLGRPAAVDPGPWAPLLDQAAAWIVPIGAGLALLMLLVLWVQLRRHSLSKVGRAVTTPLVLAWESQGLHRLAETTGVEGAAAWVLAGVTSAVLITLAAFADDHHKKHGNLGWAGRLVWIVAVPMGLTVALTSTTSAESALRIILPLLAALVWWVPYAPDITGRAADGQPIKRAGSLRISPRRIGVWLGLFDPTDADLTVVHEERQIRRLTATAHKLHHGRTLLRPYRKARLRRLGLVATPEMVTEVARRVQLVHEIEARTAPNGEGNRKDGARAEEGGEGVDARADEPRETAPDAVDHTALTAGHRVGGRAADGRSGVTSAGPRR
ncbi:hypothetical protein ACQSSU_20890 [Micromonospora echinospora]